MTRLGEFGGLGIDRAEDLSHRALPAGGPLGLVEVPAVQSRDDRDGVSYQEWAPQQLLRVTAKCCREMMRCGVHGRRRRGVRGVRDAHHDRAEVLDEPLRRGRRRRRRVRHRDVDEVAAEREGHLLRVEPWLGLGS